MTLRTLMMSLIRMTKTNTNYDSYDNDGENDDYDVHDKTRQDPY